MSTNAFVSVVAILGIGLPMLFLAFDYAVFGVLTLVLLVTNLLRHG